MQYERRKEEKQRHYFYKKDKPLRDFLFLDNNILIQKINQKKIFKI